MGQLKVYTINGRGRTHYRTTTNINTTKVAATILLKLARTDSNLPEDVQDHDLVQCLARGEKIQMSSGRETREVVLITTNDGWRGEIR